MFFLPVLPILPWAALKFRLAFGLSDDAPRIIEDEKELKKRRLEKKRQLKMKFDIDYDGDDAGGKSHYEDLKKEDHTASKNLGPDPALTLTANTILNLDAALSK